MRYVLRKIIIASAALLAASVLNAQQASWGGGPVESPLINGGRTLTFRLFATGAQEVILFGDFLPLLFK